MSLSRLECEIHLWIYFAEISMLLGFGWHSGVQSMEGEGQRRGNAKRHYNLGCGSDSVFGSL